MKSRKNPQRDHSNLKVFILKVIVKDLVIFVLLNVSLAQRGPLLASDLHVANGIGIPFDLHAKRWQESDALKFEGPADYSLALVECILIVLAAPAMPIAWFWFGRTLTLRII